MWRTFFWKIFPLRLGILGYISNFFPKREAFILKKWDYLFVGKQSVFLMDWSWQKVFASFPPPRVAWPHLPHSSRLSNLPNWSMVRFIIQSSSLSSIYSMGLWANETTVEPPLLLLPPTLSLLIFLSLMADLLTQWKISNIQIKVMVTRQ